MTVHPVRLGSRPRCFRLAAAVAAGFAQPTWRRSNPPAVVTPEVRSSIVAGAEVTREALSIVVSRSNGLAAASWLSRDAMWEMFWARSWDRRGPYSICPSGRRGVSGS